MKNPFIILPDPKVSTIIMTHGTEIDLYSPGCSRYLQCLEAFSFNTILPDLKRRLSGTGWKPEVYFERVIKLHALFGGRITITSITPISSTVLLRLFLDPNFLKFLELHKGFLEFRCNFNRDISTTGDDSQLRSERVLSGLKRALDEDWCSSLYDDLTGDVGKRALGTKLVKTTAETMLNHVAKRNRFDLMAAKQELRTKILSIATNNQPVSTRHIDLLQALPAILDHFLNDSGTYVDRTRADFVPRTIYQTVLDSIKTLPQSEGPLNDIAKFVEQCGKDSSFSTIIREVEKNPKLKKANMILQTACYAYNSQLVESAGSAFGSYLQLKDGVPIGIPEDHFNSVITYPTKSDPITSWGLRAANFIGLECDLDQIDWGAIANAMSQPELARSAVGVQGYLQEKNPNNDAALAYFKEHASKLVKYLKKQEDLPGPRPILMMIAGAVGGAALGGAAIFVGLGATDMAELFRKNVAPGNAAIAGARLGVWAVQKFHTYVGADFICKQAIQEYIH